MNSSLEPPRTVVFALCGSFCTFETVLPQIIRLRACGWEVLPMLSYAASPLDTRFGRAADWKQRLEEATGHRPLEDLREAEQCWQALPLRFAGFHQLREIDASFRDVRVRAHADVAQLVNVIVVIAPPGNIVSTQHLAGFLGAHCNLLHGA